MQTPANTDTGPAPGGISRRGFGAASARFAAVSALPGMAGASPVGDLLDDAVAGGDPPGAVALVARGEQVEVHAAGLRDVGTGAPMARDTIFRVASMTKPVTAAAALLLVEDGVLALDAPVDDWLPELADRQVLRSLDAPLDDTVPAQRPITLRDLLTMQFGLGAVFADPSGSPLLMRMAELEVAPGPFLFADDPDDYMCRLGGLPLMHQPGEGWRYHTGLDVAGVMVARAGGGSLGGFLRDRLFGPLGMADTGFHAPPDSIGRLATAYWRDPGSGALTVWDGAEGGRFAAPPPFEAGGGGLVSTADDFLAFGRMLLAGGAHEGRRVMAESSVAEMLRDQISPQVKAASPFFPGFWDTQGWGLGLAVAAAPDDIAPAPGRFGWWGGYGTTFFARPQGDRVAILLTQRMMGGADDTALSDDFLTRALGGE